MPITLQAEIDASGKGVTSLSLDNLIEGLIGDVSLIVVGLLSTTVEVTSIVPGSVSGQTLPTYSRRLRVVGDATAIELWQASSTDGVRSMETCTINFSAAVTAAAKRVEFDGVKRSGVSDGTGSATGSSTSPASGSVTPAQAKGLVVAAHSRQGTATVTAGPTNSFTALAAVGTSGGAASSNVQLSTAYKLVAGGAPHSTGWTISASSAWAGLIAACKERQRLLSRGIALRIAISL